MSNLISKKYKDKINLRSRHALITQVLSETLLLLALKLILNLDSRDSRIFHLSIRVSNSTLGKGSSV